jgi:uncharacterized protein (DUF1330 family)
MLFYTQLVFIKEDKELLFQSFEDNVLPLLSRHNGKLLYRVRPDKENVIETAIEYPYEVHLISFETKDDFVAYANDKERQQYLAMKNESVAKVMLIEGSLV